jgi:hypothetical protein
MASPEALHPAMDTLELPSADPELANWTEQGIQPAQSLAGSVEEQRVQSPQVSSTECILPRFVPDRFVIRDGKQMLRGVVLMLGDPRTTPDVSVDKWTDAIEAAVSGPIRIAFAKNSLPGWAGDSADWVEAVPLIDTADETRQSIAALWKALMTPAAATLSLEVQSVISSQPKSLERDPSRFNFGVMRFGPRTDTPGGDPFHAYRLDASARVLGRSLGGTGPLRVTNAGGAALAQRLSVLGGDRLKHNLRRAALKQGLGILVHEDSQFDPWGGVGRLFSGPRMPPPKKVVATDGQPTDTISFIAGEISRRGLKAATDVANKADDARKSRARSEPFHRTPASPRPDESVTVNLQTAIELARLDDATIARSVHEGIPLPEGKFTFERALVAHMMALRPDAPVIGSPLSLTGVGGQSHRLAPERIAAILRMLDQAQHRRLAGLLEYPALARTLRLAVDVEIPVDSLPNYAREGNGSPVRFLAAVVLGGTFARLPAPAPSPESAPVTQADAADLAPGVGAATPVMAGEAQASRMAALQQNSITASLWTSCQLVDGRLSIVGVDEANPAAAVNPERKTGLLNFSQTLAEGGRRFSAITLDIVSRAEQLINEARTESDRKHSGSPAEVEPSQGRAQSGGLTILDSARARVIQRDADRAQSQNAALGRHEAAVLYAEDLSGGLRYDVGVYPGRDAGRDIEWRSLMMRQVRFGPVKTVDGIIAVEPLVERAMRAVEPDAPDLFRARLDEASYKPASRIIATRPQQMSEQFDEAEIIAGETIGVWQDGLLGLPCGTEMAPPEDGLIRTSLDEQSGDNAADLPLPVVLSPTSLPDRAPPRYEFGRWIWLNARDVYLGGAGLTTEEAAHIYGSAQGATLSLPPRDEHMIIERHERLGAPIVATLYPDVNNGPGETVNQLVVRSGRVDRFNTPVDRRILFVPGVPQAMASIHPHPEPIPPSSKNHPRALDLVPSIRQSHPLPGHVTAGVVPVGGLVNVALDSETGGLAVLVDGESKPASSVTRKMRADRPVREAPPKGVFRVKEGSWEALAERWGHYYPDPAADALMLELATKETIPQPIKSNDAQPSVLKVELYDQRYRVAVPKGWPDARGSVPCCYPFAMPVLLEAVRAGRGSRPVFSAAPEVGTVDDRGRFRALKPGQRPHSGTITVQRVRVLLPPGAEVTLRSWCATNATALEYMAALNQILPARRDRYNVTGGPRASNIDQARAAAIDLLASAPIPEQAEVSELTLVHAVQMPATPTFNMTTARPLTLRRDIAEDRWPDWVAVKENQPENWQKEGKTLHVNAATTTWLGGAVLIDRQVAAAITLEFSVHDVRDEPGTVLKMENGKLSFPWIGLETVTQKLKAPTADRTVPAESLERVDLLLEGFAPRQLALSRLGSSANLVRVIPRSISRFTGYLPPADPSMFESVGRPFEFWVLATRRPDSMGKVEVLPAFVWETNGNGCTRRTLVRLTWRRPKRDAALNSQEQTSTGCWFSSGKGERLGVVLAPGGDRSGLKAGVRYISQWGADPIRDNVDDDARPDWSFGVERFPLGEGVEHVADQWMPLPGNRDDGDACYEDETEAQCAARLAKLQFGTKVDLLTYEPIYDSDQDAWWVDVLIDPGKVAAPFIQLGLVRYQEHAKFDIEDPREDLRVSTPERIGCVLEPMRTVTVVMEPKNKVDDTWPVRVRVSGPAGVVRGGYDSVPEPWLRERLARQSRPHFMAKVMRARPGHSGGGEEQIAFAQSDNSPPPSGDVLWEAMIHLREKPTNSPHYIFIEERDEMLSADQGNGDAPADLVMSGPRFMAKVKIERNRPAKD